MEKSIIRRYGLITVGILAIANLTAFIFKDQEGLSPTVARATSYNSKALNTIPNWLRAELENTHKTVDIFQTTQTDAADKIIAATMKEDDPAETLPIIDNRNTDTESLPAAENKIKILAINLSGNRPSGLIEYKGKVQTVFTGNVVDDHYVVRKISDGTIWFDTQR